mgnify:CR=1 FL=1
MSTEKPLTASIYSEKTQHNLKEMGVGLTQACHGIARECGWWETTTERDVPRLLMLCVSELAEAMEADRKSLMDSHLSQRNGLEVELADTVIRIFDMAGGLGLDVAGALAEKLAYNTTRHDHKPEVRADGGKKY